MYIYNFENRRQGEIALIKKRRESQSRLQRQQAPDDAVVPVVGCDGLRLAAPVASPVSM